MTSIFEVLPLSLDYASARGALRQVVTAMIAHGTPARMQLHAEVGPATLRKHVILTFARTSEGTRFDEVWSISWEPENGGPFPDFAGTVSVQFVEDGSAQLEIRGEYAPPLGAIGKGFDLVAGQRIAARTCRNLLTEIAKDMERYCAA